MGENFVELAADGALTGRIALALDVGGILKQREDAGFAVFGEGVQVEEMVVGGRGIDFEIAGVDDDSERRVNGEGDAIDQAVRDSDGVDSEDSGFEALVGAHLAQVGVFEEAVLVEFVFDVSQREFRAPNRDVEIGKNPGQRADVIFVAVGEHNAADAMAIFGEIRNVGNDDIDAEQFGFGKHEAGVDDENVVSIANGHAVHTELAQAAEGDDLQLSSWHSLYA